MVGKLKNWKEESWIVGQLDSWTGKEVHSNLQHPTSNLQFAVGAGFCARPLLSTNPVEACLAPTKNKRSCPVKADSISARTQHEHFHPYDGAGNSGGGYPENALHSNLQLPTSNLQFAVGAGLCARPLLSINPVEACLAPTKNKRNYPVGADSISARCQQPRLLNLQLFAEGEDKTEQPTPHRLREARKRGQVMKSMELNAAINMLGMVSFFLLIWPFFRDGLFAMLNHYLLVLPVEAISGEFPIQPIIQFSLYQFMGLVLPFLLAAFFISFFANVVQVGFLVSTEALKPQLNRINPVEGFKRILSRRALFEMVKSVLKVVIFALVSYFYLRSQLPPLLLLFGQDTWVAANLLAKVLVGLAFRVAALFFALAIIDFIYQRYEFLKNLRMSRRDVKDEYKQMEGDPHVRARLRERQRAMARERSMAQVPEATVVVTNPTELAVALRYEQKEKEAPVVLAKGAGVLAQRIREIAREHEIPIIQNPPVARLLYREVEIGEEIPANLYQAVAEILALVYRMQEKERQRRRRAGA